VTTRPNDEPPPTPDETDTAQPAEADEAIEDPATYPVAGVRFQPRADLVAQANALPLPLELRSRLSVLRFLRAWALLCLSLFVFFDLVGLFVGWHTWLTPIYQAQVLVIAALISCFAPAWVYVLDIILRRMTYYSVKATGEGLVGFIHGVSGQRVARWDEIRAWTVLPLTDFYLGRERVHTIWTSYTATGEPRAMLSWIEYTDLPLAGPSGWWRGRAAARQRAQALNAVIAAKAGVPLRLTPM
jgi:hypothetical protein